MYCRFVFRPVSVLHICTCIKRAPCFRTNKALDFLWHCENVYLKFNEPLICMMAILPYTLFWDVWVYYVFSSMYLLVASFSFVVRIDLFEFASFAVDIVLISVTNTFFVLFSPFSFDWFYVRFYHAVLVSRRIYYIYSIILSVRIWVVLIILCQINALFLLWFKYHKNTYTHTAQNRCRFKWITVGIYSMNCKRNALNWMANYLSLYKLQITKMPNRIAEKNKHFINYSIPFLLDTPWKVYFERKMKEKKIARKLKKRNHWKWNELKRIYEEHDEQHGK